MNLGQVGARYPKKRTFRHLLGYLVCALLQKQWHVQPEGLGGLGVDDQLKFGRLFDWQVSRYGFKSAATEEILGTISLSNSSSLNKMLHL